jgi:threonine/homoserine/homoserine lactone efflux protein
VLIFFLIGAAAGAITGIPIGPVNVAVIDAAYRHTMRRAWGVGLGGALADGAYAALGLIGVKPILDAHPGIPPVLYLLSGAVLLVYGFLTARSNPVPPPPTDAPHASESVMMREELLIGFKLGLALIVLNPAAITVWVVMMANLVPAASASHGIACALGVMLGSFGWFALVAYLTHKGKSVLGDKAAWIPRAVGVGLMAYSLYLLFKAARYYFFS